MPIRYPAAPSANGRGSRITLKLSLDGQKVLLAVKSMGGDSAEAWRIVLDDLNRRGLRRPELLIVDGGSGLDAAIATLWSDVPVRRCTVQAPLCHPWSPHHCIAGDERNPSSPAGRRERLVRNLLKLQEHDTNRPRGGSLNVRKECYG
jgi:hypothetical protein